MYSFIFPNAKLITLSAKTYDIYHFFSASTHKNMLTASLFSPIGRQK